MKFEPVDSEIEVFKPVSIKITFESEEEIAAIRKFMQYNVSLPEKYRETPGAFVSDKELSIISNFMGEMTYLL